MAQLLKVVQACQSVEHLSCLGEPLGQFDLLPVAPLDPEWLAEHSVELVDYSVFPAGGSRPVGTD
jgi:hypothetical protein